MVASNRVNEDSIVGLGIEHLEWEIGDQAATSSTGSRLAVERKCCSKLSRSLNLCTKAGAKARANGLVVRGLCEQLCPRLSCEACTPHGAMRRASAKTSSAAKVWTSPRS